MHSEFLKLQLYGARNMTVMKNVIITHYPSSAMMSSADRRKGHQKATAE